MTRFADAAPIRRRRAPLTRRLTGFRSQLSLLMGRVPKCRRDEPSKKDTRVNGSPPLLSFVTAGAALAVIASVSFAQAAPAPAPPAPPATPATEPAAALTPVSFQTGFSAGESPTYLTEELDEIYTPSRGVLDVPWFDRPFEGVLGWTTDLEAQTGLRLGFAYTTIFQQATGGPGSRGAGSGDFDIMGAWTLLGRGTRDTGRLIMSAEYRHKIGNQPVSSLAGEIGSLQQTASGFNDRGWVIRDLHWLQRLFDDRLRIGVGRADSSDFVGGHRLGNLNASFVNRAFASNTTTAFPGHGTTAGFSVRPTEVFYTTLGASNAYNQTNRNDMSLLDELEFFSFGEVGLTPTFDGLGPGRYRLMLWHMDSREKDSIAGDKGYSVILEQDFGEVVQAFFRFGEADKGVLTGIKRSTEVGVGFRGLLGSPDNLGGVAFAYSEPTLSTAQDEKIVEVFHRWQLTNVTQLSVSVQGIFDPSFAPDTDAVGVFTMRLRIAF